MISASLRKRLETILSGQLKKPVAILSVEPVGGGCINHACRIETGNGPFFVKWNDAKRYPGMFDAEGKGLQLLSGGQVIRVPAVIATGEEGNLSFIVLEWLEAGRREKNFWLAFGQNLARLHRQTAPAFGLGHDNYIGSLPQSNVTHDSWIDFFIQERINPQLKQAVEAGAIRSSRINLFERVFARLPAIFPDEKPALLHGDLWSGNYLAGPDGHACLIDPAVYFGHREMDLAMTRLFGGFDNDFYEGYHQIFPLEKGFGERVNLYNLYPLLVHVNLFGGSYAGQVHAIISRFA